MPEERPEEIVDKEETESPDSKMINLIDQVKELEKMLLNTRKEIMNLEFSLEESDIEIPAFFSKSLPGFLDKE